MKNVRCFALVLSLGLGAVSAVAAEAPAAGSPFAWFAALFQANRVDYLMVTGNYLKPRLLAELAQQKSGQPILLVSPTREGGEELYFLPAKDDALQESARNFVALVEFVNPRQVVFIGDSDCMPTTYVELLRNRLPVVVVAGDDWGKNAETLANTLKLRGLSERFARFLAVVERAPPPPSAETLIPEPAVPAAIPAGPVTPEPAAPAAPVAPLEKKVTVKPGVAQ